METTPDAPARYGFDTGFFRRLHDGDDQARAAWADVRSGAANGVVSCITLFELARLGLRGVIPHTVVEALVGAIPTVCAVVWLDAEVGADRLDRAARRAHGVGLALADAIILTSLLDADVETVYTTDSDFERYDGATTIVRL